MLDEFNVRRSDILFFFKDRIHLVGEKSMEEPPDLAIEIISPSSATTDRDDKFVQYRKAGVRFYWIVDPQLKTVEGWELKRNRYVATGRAQGAATITLVPFPDLQIPLSDLWRK